MSYDKPQTREYIYTDATFGATSVVHNAISPKGCVGYVRDISVDVTTSLVGTTTVPEIQVGKSSGDSTYGRYRLGSTASLGYDVGIHLASQEATIIGNPPRNSQSYAHRVELDGYPLDSTNNRQPLGRIPADTAFTIVALAGVGGTPAGAGNIRVTIEWHGQVAT